jgi:hypothetical protein
VILGCLSQSTTISSPGRPAETNDRVLFYPRDAVEAQADPPGRRRAIDKTAGASGRNERTCAVAAAGDATGEQLAAGRDVDGTAVSGPTCWVKIVR